MFVKKTALLMAAILIASATVAGAAATKITRRQQLLLQLPDRVVQQKGEVLIPGETKPSQSTWAAIHDSNGEPVDLVIVARSDMLIAIASDGGDLKSTEVYHMVNGELTNIYKGTFADGILIRNPDAFLPPSLIKELNIFALIAVPAVLKHFNVYLDEELERYIAEHAICEPTTAP